MTKIRRYTAWVLAVLLGTAITSCNSNDDAGVAEIEIPGVTIDGDTDCCSAEEALQVYRFLQTVRIVPELSTTVGDKYNIFAYSRTGTFHTGYNEVFFVATKKQSGNYVKQFDITNLTPLMTMEAMNMKHSAPVSAGIESFNSAYLAVKRGWVAFLMAGQWTLSYDVSLLGVSGGVSQQAVDVSALGDGQRWLQSFRGHEGATYYLSLVTPTDWQTGTNTMTAYVSQKAAEATTAYPLASEQFTIDIDPRMPDMGGHTSPGNTPLTLQLDGSYQGTINLTMTGLWRIFLTVRDAKGDVVAGGDETLYWDVTI